LPIIEEEWREIEGFNRYYVSNLGRVKSKIGREKILNQYKVQGNYLQVKLRKDNKSYNRSVHRLVANAFVYTDDKTKEVHHINGIISDNTYNNLIWLTREEHNKIHNGEINIDEIIDKINSDINK
jgi:hypothetical protein